MNKNDLLQLTTKMVAINSVTGSKDKKGEYNENNMADFIAQELNKHGIPTEFLKTSDGRKIVSVFKKGSSKETIVLLAHHDTVGFEDYGNINALSPADVAVQYKDKNYMYGRGAGDMKSGIAVGISILSQLYTQKLKTNIIFLSVPDEENNSMGILSAIPYLRKVKKEKSLSYKGLINLDCVLQDTSTTAKTIVTGGVIGKLLPSFFVVGKSAHASDPFSGISSNAIGSEIIQELESNPKYSNKNKYTKEYSPPPVCLKYADLKSEYNTQLPLKSYVYFNFLTFHQSPQDVLRLMEKVAAIALKKALDKNKKMYQQFAKKRKERKWDKKIIVLSYEKLEKMVLKKYPSVKKEIEGILQQPKDPREVNREVVEVLTKYIEIDSPFVVCYFSPPFYPSSYAKNSPFIKHIKKTLKTFSENNNIVFYTKEFSEGITDMNYVQIEKKSESSMHAYFTNNPLSKFSPEFNPKDIGDISMPPVAVGPYTLHPHEKEEKVEIEYTFEILPKLLKEIILSLE